MAKKVLKANVTAGDVPEGNLLRASVPGGKVTMTHRCMATVATGVSVTPDKGHKLCFSLAPELSGKGVIAVNAPGNVTEGPVSLVLLNCGREIIDVKNGDPLARVWLEPVLDFVWSKDQQVG